MKNIMIDVGIPCLFGLVLGNWLGGMAIAGTITMAAALICGLIINTIIFFFIYPSIARFLKGEK